MLESIFTLSFAVIASKARLVVIELFLSKQQQCHAESLLIQPSTNAIFCYGGSMHQVYCTSIILTVLVHRNHFMTATIAYNNYWQVQRKISRLPILINSLYISSFVFCVFHSDQQVSQQIHIWYHYFCNQLSVWKV